MFKHFLLFFQCHYILRTMTTYPHSKQNILRTKCFLCIPGISFTNISSKRKKKGIDCHKKNDTCGQTYKNTKQNFKAKLLIAPLEIKKGLSHRGLVIHANLHIKSIHRRIRWYKKIYSPTQRFFFLIPGGATPLRSHPTENVL